MATILGICNSALIAIGADRITSLLENNKRAVLCNEQYDKMRREVLRAHPWNFATKRTQIAALITPPVYGFSNAFQLPNDCLRVFELEDRSLRYKVEGRQILASTDVLNIKYLSDVTDASLFDDLFAEVLAKRLAADLAYSLVQSNNLMDQMFSLYERMLRMARTADAQEGTPDDFTDDIFLNVRL